MSIRLVLAAALAAPFLVPAAGAGTVSVGAFNRVALHGGGHIVLKHGAARNVSLTRGSTDVTSFTIRNGDELDIDVCGNTVIMCPMNYDLDITITAPSITAVAVQGGGEIETEGSFPVQDNLSVSVHGGGDVDLSAISVRNVKADVHGGGDLKITATATLDADVHGGGDIEFRGHPVVTQSVHGGGSIEGE